METKTAFDLNTAIQRWRDQLGQSPHFRPENIEELEIHLRDSVAAFQSKALSEEEAFLVATRRIGGVPALEPEFAKVNGKEVWTNRLLWMLLGAQLWPLVCSCASAVADATVMGGLLGFGRQFKSPTGPDGVLPSVVFATATANVLALGGCVAACWWVLRRKGRTFTNTAVSLLRRPLFVPILVCAILLCLGWGLSAGRQVLLVRCMGLHGPFISVLRGSFLSYAVVAFALAVVTVLLARRQLRPSANS